MSFAHTEFVGEIGSLRVTFVIRVSVLILQEKRHHGGTEKLFPTDSNGAERARHSSQCQHPYRPGPTS